MINKIETLKNILNDFESAVIAFSGGVDSTLLARIAKDIYNDNLLLITATSSTYPFYELEEASSLAVLLGIRHITIVSEELEIPGYTDNPPDRCFYCKSELFRKLKFIADRDGFDVVFDGSNADDLNDFRPGMKAKEKYGVLSPLAAAGLTKLEIRRLSKEYNLPTADKQSYACLASRFPYGEKITKEKLDRVGIAEFEIRKLGFTQFRVRSHNELARIEFISEEMEMAWNRREKITEICKTAGFSYVSLDMNGYRTGSMNETLTDSQQEEILKSKH